MYDGLKWLPCWVFVFFICSFRFLWIWQYDHCKSSFVLKKVNKNRNVDRETWCLLPGEFLARSFFRQVYNFSCWKNSSSWGTVLAHKNWLFHIFTCISSFTQFAALPIWTWTQTTMIRKWKIIYTKKKEIQILISMQISFSSKMVPRRRGLLWWRLGQAQGSCHLSSTGAKWLSPMLTPALVVPCWWDQLTNQGGLIFVGSLWRKWLTGHSRSSLSSYFFKKVKD